MDVSGSNIVILIKSPGLIFLMADIFFYFFIDIIFYLSTLYKYKKNGRNAMVRFNESTVSSI